MSGPQVVLAHASKILMLALLAGMIWRGRVTHCWSFALYITAALVANLLITFWPGRFYTTSFWMLKQAFYDTIKAAVGVEIACRALAAFPGTWRLARSAFAALLVLTTGVLVWVTPRASFETMWRWHPSVLTAAVWPLTVTALIVTWYRLPIGAWPRAIMLGLAPYLLSGVLLRMLQRHGTTLEWAGRVDSVAWLALMTFWAYVAWRRDERTAPSPDRLSHA
jgi:hypothetical protein